MTWIRTAPSLVARHIKHRLTAGFLVLVPLGVTVIVLKVLFEMLDPPMQSLVFDRFQIFDQVYSTFPGIGIIAVVLMTYLVGLVASLVIGRRFIAFGNRLVDMIPLIKNIYGVVRMATETFSKSTDRFEAVVLVEFPIGSGMRSIGLVTGRLITDEGTQSLTIFVPTAPNPTSGFLTILPESKAHFVDLTVEQAMKMVVSGGFLTPESISTQNVTADQVTDRTASNQ